MTLTRIGTIQDSESGTDFYRLADLFNPDDENAPTLGTLVPTGDLRDLIPTEMQSLTDVLKDYLDTEHNLHSRSCSCAHDCCGHRFHSAPQLIPDLIHDEFIIRHAWGLNI